MKLHHTIAGLFCLFSSVGAVANTYVNLTPYDTTSFGNASGQRVNVNLTGLSNTGWNRYSEFLGGGERWVWTNASSEAVYIYNEEREVSEQLVNFADPVGRSYSFSLGSCTNGGTLAQKGLTLATPAGVFKNVVRMSFTNTCADAGTIEAWFAPRVGVIKWSTQSFAGPVSFELSNGKVGGRVFGASSLQNALKVTATFPRNYFVLGATAEQVGATLQLTNASAQDLVLHFNSGQEFEISLLDPNNIVINTWSANIRFIQGFHDVRIAAGQSRSFGGAMALQNLNGQPLRPGQYTLRIEMKGTQTVGGGVTLPTAIRAESPIYVVRGY